MQTLTITWGYSSNIVHLSDAAAWSLCRNGAANFEIVINGHSRVVSLAELGNYQAATKSVTDPKKVTDLLEEKLRAICNAWLAGTPTLNLDFQI